MNAYPYLWVSADIDVTPGTRVVERLYLEAELPAEGKDEAAEAAVDVEADAALEGDVGEVADGVDGAVAVVAGRAHQRHRLVVDVIAHPVDVDLRRGLVDRRPAQLHAEEVAGLVERRVGGLGLDQVRARHSAGLRPVLPVRQDGVHDAPRPARGDQPAGVVTGGRGVLAAVQAQGHRDDLGLELGRARAHVPLEHVHVGEQAEGLVHEAVVLVVAAVHRA